MTVSACWSAALTLAEQRRLLKLPAPEDPAEQATPGLAGEREAGELEPGRVGGREAAGGLAAELAERLGCAVLAMRFPVVDDFAIALAGSCTSCWREGAAAAAGAGERAAGPGGDR